MRHGLLLLTAVAALAVAACGSSDDGGGTTGAGGGKGGDKAFEGALKFAKCMRDHGVDMPDPKRAGGGGITMARKGNPNSPTSKAAEKACEKYMEVDGGGEAPDPAKVAKMKESMLAYARCMRDEGVDMPDPEFSNGGARVKMGEPGSKIRPDSPKFKAADKVCHSKLAGVDGPGGSTGSDAAGTEDAG